MAFGSGGGQPTFTFGQGNSNQNQNQGSGFGGFGNTSNNTGFGANTTGSAFGSSTAASNPFSTSAFGSNTGGTFGASTNTSTSLFGNKPASNPFGSTTSNPSGGLFGGGTSTGGGFGSSTGFGNANSNAFGSNNTSTSFSFGNAPKPAFGASAPSTNLFGQGGAGTTGGFGGSTPFGSTGVGTALNPQSVPPSEGTVSPPFAPTIEKDTPGSTTSNAYQSITFQQPYQKYSFEELRLADYNAGRRFGNGSGQAGAFGSSSFGGFGGNTTGGFGSNNPNPSTNPFGSANTTSTGFGAGTATSSFGSGNLFGNKPASTGLFGGQSSTAPSTGLFGTSNTTNTGFGGGSTGFGGNSGSNLFGGNQQTQKPNLFGSNPAQSASPGFSFGNNPSNPTNTSTGLFGNNNASTQQQTSTGLFGNTAQPQNKSLFGGATGGGFGSTSTQGQSSGNLFGGAGNTTSTGLFGNTGNQNAGTSTGLFGNPQQTNTGLFGNSGTNNQPSKPSLFGGAPFGNQPQSQNNTSLFGNANTGQSNQPSNLFGGGNNSSQGSGFSFGGNNASKPQTSLFGGAGTNQSSGMFGATNSNSNLFGTSQGQQQQNQQQDGFKHASLLDPNPYGQSSIWTGLPAPTPDNAKPLVTPLSATQKLKESQAKPPPSLRLNHSRYMTPPKRQGFGFSYSTYGTPNSAASTPGGAGLTNSMYSSRGFTGGSFGRTLGKSASIGNLRSQYTDTDSVLSPGAFTPGASRYSGGSIRRLTIDRSIRADLFSRPSLPALPAPTNAVGGTTSGQTARAAPVTETSQEAPGKLKKRVSFDKDTTGGQTNGELNGETGALVRTDSEDDEASTEPVGSTARRGRNVNGAQSNNVDQTRGKELAVVPEDRESEQVPAKPQSPVKVQAKQDPKPGDYWMKPSRAEMSKMPRDKLQRFANFEVGRQGCGKVIFNGTVDLTAIPLDELYDKIVEIRVRSVTVYPDASSKPPMGKGLNVPSTISIENSWPRANKQPLSVTSGPVFEKHVSRLKKMHGTEFVSYDIPSGIWTFKVPHYTRYGLDYDEEDYDDSDESQLSAPPDTLEQPKSVDASVMEVDSDNYDDSAEDDTFAFKQKHIPGGFGRQSAVDFRPDSMIVRSIEEDDSKSEHSEYSDEDGSDNEMSMAGSFPAPAGPKIDFESPNKPVLKSTRFPGTPGKPLLDLDGDWAEQLQRTISPRKQNRDVLREVQSKILLDRTYEPIKPKLVNNKEFRTSIDVMNSLFSQHEERRIRGGKGQAQPDFEFPYAKRAKTFDPSSQDMTSEDRRWHASFKPKFTSTNQLVCKSQDAAKSDDEWNACALVESENRVVTLTSVKPQPEALRLNALLKQTSIRLIGGAPFIEYLSLPFSKMADTIPSDHPQNLAVYELLHVLFDTYEDGFSYELTDEQREEFADRIRKDRLNEFLSKFILQQHGQQINETDKRSGAEAALLYLTVRNVHDACEALMKAKNFHLMMLIAQIENADTVFQQDMANQIAAWKEQNIISEMTEDIRALYEILAGNTTVAQGQPNGPVEDRASTFAISEKFGLDWVQCFGLCLWYGKEKNGTIEQAVADFAKKIKSHEETASPIDADGKEDPLWVMLKLFASTKSKIVDPPVLPQALIALSRPWDWSSTFLVHQSIIAGLQDATVRVHDESVDDLTSAFASQLDARGDIVGAAFVLLHLQDPRTRAESVLDLLLRHAAAIPEPPIDGETDPKARQTSSGFMWTTLTSSLHIPVQWIHQAKALYARSAHDSFAELHHLILADELAAAHDCLCRRVAPRLVIDEDWSKLREVIASFGTNVGAKIGDWNHSGGIYSGLVTLLDGKKTEMQDPKQRAATLERMQKSLSAMGARFAARGTDLGAGGLEELEERVAVKEMGRLVAELLEGEGASKKAILELPLTADVRLALARNMGVDHYRGVMAAV